MSVNVLRFSSKHSRNCHDWKYETSEDGRHVLVSKGGVRKRCGLVITGIAKFGSLSLRGAAEYLHANFHKSYTTSDMVSVFTALLKANIVIKNGRSYELTKNGNKIWSKMEKVWLGK